MRWAAPSLNTARAQIVGMSVGTLKILFHRETKEILGIHCFGERAAEIIHIGRDHGAERRWQHH